MGGRRDDTRLRLDIARNLALGISASATLGNDGATDALVVLELLSILSHPFRTVG